MAREVFLLFFSFGSLSDGSPRGQPGTVRRSRSIAFPSATARCGRRDLVSLRAPRAGAPVLDIVDFRRRWLEGNTRSLSEHGS